MSSPPGMHRAVRALGVFAGCVCLVLAVLGVLLPVLPTTPFLLLASALFARSSPRLQAWLQKTRLFGPLLVDWERERGVRLHVKVAAVVVVLAVVATGLFVSDLPAGWRAVLVGLAAFGLVIVLRLRTVDGGKVETRRQR